MVHSPIWLINPYTNIVCIKENISVYGVRKTVKKFVSFSANTIKGIVLKNSNRLLYRIVCDITNIGSLLLKSMAVNRRSALVVAKEITNFSPLITLMEKAVNIVVLSMDIMVGYIVGWSTNEKCQNSIRFCA